MKAHKMTLFGLLIVCILFISFASDVYAIGVSPARSYVTYEEGAPKSIRLRILSDGNPTRVSLYATGELAKFVQFSTNMVTFEEGQMEQEVFYTIQAPPGLDAGVHEADIVALELPDINPANSGEKKTSVVATTAVASKLQVQVPYPGKYVRGKALISEALTDEYVTFKINAYNFGEEAASEVYARVEIYGPTNNLLGEVTTNKASIDPKNEVTLVASWFAQVEAGRYLAKITLYYDGQKVAFEETFNVGDIAVRIRDINVDPFKLGEVAKFNLALESIWNQPLANLYATAEVYDSKGGHIDSFKSAPTELPPKGEASLPMFWDTTGIAEGRYDIKFVLNYGTKTSEKVLNIMLSLNGIEAKLIGTGQAVTSEESLIKRDSVLIALVIILVALNGFIIYRFIIKKGGSAQ